MSEPKAFDIVVAEEGYSEGIVTYRRAVYDKSEADKVIAELEEKLKNSSNARKYWRNEYLIEYKECHHSKYKRCMAMVVICFNRAERANCWKEEVKSRKRFEKWLALAEKFKEADK